jgi:preprotein translocase subunit SecF
MATSAPLQETRIDFLRHARLAISVSLLVIVGGVVSLAMRGLELGIDFTGGTLVELVYPEPVDLADVRGGLAAGGVQGAVVQHFGSAREVLVRIPGKAAGSMAELSTRVHEALRAKNPAVELRRVEYVGPQVGDELVTDGALAVLYSLIGILIYVAFRFEWRFAVGAIAALVHDVLVTVGFFSLTGMEFDLTVLAAVLTVVGYSINDTIVIYDRIRELFPRLRQASTTQVVNAAVNQTLRRTIRTSLTVLLSILPLLLIGGQVIHGFAVALMVGLISGTYSTVYIASWLLVPLGLSRRDMVKAKPDAAAP